VTAENFCAKPHVVETLEKLMPLLRPISLLALAAVIGVSACARKEGGMMNLRSSGAGPDEFAILPTKPLTQPKNYKVLPAPTPGGANLTDPTPRADAVVAMGGNPKYLTAAGVSRGDQGVIATASRYGVSGNIRDVLAREDKEFRKKHRGKLLERLFGVTVYFSAYQPMTLDRYGELERMRRAGVRTVAAPPDTRKKKKRR